MSLAVLHSRTLAGVAALPVTVEAPLANALPSFTIVGLPEAELRESKNRVRAALQGASVEFPMRRITINLTSADLPEESGRFNLPIALGILAASGQLPADKLHEYEFAGELALTGALRPVRGALAMTLGAQGDGRAFELPAEDAAQAAVVEGATVYALPSLLAVCAHLPRQEKLVPYTQTLATQEAHYPDLQDVWGQDHAKRVLGIAAVGGHTLPMTGPPGTGKTMLASRPPGILPPMTQQEALESAAMQSLVSAGFDVSRSNQRPYRSPHYAASAVALGEGGGNPRPGKISMAMQGVLFLDESPEFQPNLLEVLREPLESGRIPVPRAARQATFPGEFQMECACGCLGHALGKCRLTPDQVACYRSRIFGPLLDRIDLQIEVPSLSQEALTCQTAAQSSVRVHERVSGACEHALSCQDKSNTMLSTSEIDQHGSPDARGPEMLKRAISRLLLSARAYHRILKVARTIADLAAAQIVGVTHVAEAIQYGRFERG